MQLAGVFLLTCRINCTLMWRRVNEPLFTCRELKIRNVLYKFEEEFMSILDTANIKIS